MTLIQSLEKLPLSSAIGFLQCFAIHKRHHEDLVIESPFFSQCAVDVDLVECDSDTVTSKPMFFDTVTRHLEMVDVVMRLCGLIKLIKRFWFFRRSLVFSI